VIPARGNVCNLNAGVLVLADLNANRQVQRIQEAGRPLAAKFLANWKSLRAGRRNCWVEAVLDVSESGAESPQYGNGSALRTAAFGGRL